MKIKVALVLVFLLCFGSPVSAQSSSGDAILVLKDIQKPQEVSPGDSFDVSFKVESGWYADTSEIYVYLEGGYPLLNSSPSEPKYIKRLGYETHSKTSSSLSYTLFADKSAPAGTYSFDVVLTYRRYADTLGIAGGYNRYREVIPMTIEVVGEPVVEVFVKSSTPGEIKSGDEAEIRLEAVNVGTEEARNVLIFPASTSEIDVLWFSSAVYVGDVSPQKSKTAAFSIEVNENVAAREYKIPMNVTYESPDGEVFAKLREISIPIEESADFNVEPVANSANVNDKEKMITFDVQNTGDKLAEEVKATLRASYPFTPTGNEYFIGELKPGEDIVVSFHIDVDSDAAAQKYPVDIIIQWEDEDIEISMIESSFVDVSAVESDPRVYYWIAGGLIALVILARIKRKIKEK
jgi:hypothetical protein